MLELNSLLKPFWGSEKWILEGWNKISNDEREDITARVENLFRDGLPFDMKHDKLLYIYLFSLMAHLEVMSIQLPIHFEERLENLTLQKLMRAQLVDEIGHAIIFTKIVFLLCAPYDSPPAYNEHLEKICHFIRSQDCMKVGLVVMNLICEGLLEEVFNIFSKYDIAPELFEIIIEDEHRHVYEADLYAEIGLPDQAVLEKKVKELEDLIISAVTLEPKYTIAFNALIGPEGVADFMLALHEKGMEYTHKERTTYLPKDIMHMTTYLFTALLVVAVFVFSVFYAKEYLGEIISATLKAISSFSEAFLIRLMIPLVIVVLFKMPPAL